MARLRNVDSFLLTEIPRKYGIETELNFLSISKLIDSVMPLACIPVLLLRTKAGCYNYVGKTRMSLAFEGEGERLSLS